MAEREYSIFTFGCGQVHANHYVKIYGDPDSAREEMFRRFGKKWSMQYKNEEDAQVKKWGYKEIK